MQKWGLIRPQRINGETVFAFADLALIRQADAELADGATFRAVLRNLLASRQGQLTLDFRVTGQPAKILQLTRPQPPPLAALLEATPPPEESSAEQYFAAASMLDDGNPDTATEAMENYRRALENDPLLVPAPINPPHNPPSFDRVVGG